MDASSKSSFSVSVLNPKPSTSIQTADSWQYQLAYEMEKLSELRRQVTAQEERFGLMQQQFEKLSSDTRGARGSAVESLVKVKERELALALMRVAELTRQLEQLRLGQLDGVLVDSTSAHAELLDRNPELLQGIVRPLKSAHQSSAIERSRSAADIVLQASTQAAATSGSANKVIADGSRFSSLPSASSRKSMVPTSATMEHSSKPVESKTEKKAGLFRRKREPDSQTASTTNTKKPVDLNENVITSTQVGYAKPSHNKSGDTSKKAALIFVKASDDVIPSSSVEQNVSLDLAPAISLNSQTDKSDSEDVAVASASSRAGTRSWVSSSGYRQKLGSQASSRYQSITSRLYGDNWLSGLGSAAGGKSTRNTAENASDNTTLSANSSDKSQVTKSLVTKTTADSPASSESFSGLNSEPTNAGSQPTGSKSAVHFVYSCSTSSRSVVERPSLTSEDGDEDIDDIDEDDDNDDDSCDSGAAGMPRIGQPSKQGDQALEEDVLRWRQRLVTSPPPRRTSHTPRRYEDHEKEPSSPGTDVTHSRSIPSDYSAVTDLETTPAESPKSPESSKHVSFDPFTLSLNAALEGELDVLQSLFSQVDDVNQSNEDGLTVLHNGICSGSHEVLEFLVHAGCDVNVADCDGWTPLHCAASSNNIEAMQLLVEHGAGVLAFTWDTERETPLDKCCPDSPGFDDCYQFLEEAEKVLGTANDGRVYAIADYNASSTDEMTFSAGDQLTVVHKGDDKETSWWWARQRDGTEGYVPQNLLALYPPTGCKYVVKKSLIETSC